MTSELIGLFGVFFLLPVAFFGLAFSIHWAVENNLKNFGGIVYSRTWHTFRYISQTIWLSKRCAKVDFVLGATKKRKVKIMSSSIEWEAVVFDGRKIHVVDTGSSLSSQWWYKS